MSLKEKLGFLSYRWRDPEWLVHKGKQAGTVELDIAQWESWAIPFLNPSVYPAKTDKLRVCKAQPVTQIDHTSYTLGPQQWKYLSHINSVSAVRRYTTFANAAKQLNAYIEALNQNGVAYCLDLDAPPLPSQKSFEIAKPISTTPLLNNDYVSELEAQLHG